MSPRSLPLACLLALLALLGCRHTPTAAPDAADAPRGPFSATPAFPGWIAACGGGEAASCSALLSSIFFSGRTELLGEGQEAFARACEAGIADGCTGAILSRLSDEEQGLDAAGLNRACTEGSRFACLMLLPMQYQAAPDHDTLHALLEEHAAQCEAEGGLRCSIVSSAFETGSGVEVDLARALSLARKGCEQKEPISCYQLGLMLHASATQGRSGASMKPPADEEGDDAETDAAPGAGDGSLGSSGSPGEVAEASASSGDSQQTGSDVTAEGPARDGETGEHFAQQAEEARAAFMTACEGQVGPACTNAAHLLFSGFGGEADPEAARLRAWQACELGERNACDLLALTDEGRIYPPPPEGTGAFDPERLRRLQEKYCGLGGPQACTARGISLAKEAQDTQRFETLEPALDWLVKGCELEGEQACQLLFSIASGSIQACDQDSRPERCLVAGFLHARAGDLPPGLAEAARANASRAEESFIRACEGGQRAACSRLEGLQKANP